MAAVDLPVPRRGSGTAAAKTPAQAGVLSAGGFSLRVFDAGLACCAVEVSAALRRCAELLPDDGSGPNADYGPEGSARLAGGRGPERGAGLGAERSPDGGAGPGGEREPDGGAGLGGERGPDGGAEPFGWPGPVNVLVVAGTVTDKLAPLVLAAYRDLPEPRRVLSFGACSNSGGPYWDSYCVTKGADQIIPVDVYVPGCPPRPEALVHGLRLLRDAHGEQR
jgi:NADH:ubiquinone oxidoreductase subunit B-like Fe-S oxidoreductase